MTAFYPVLDKQQPELPPSDSPDFPLCPTPLLSIISQPVHLGHTPPTCTLIEDVLVEWKLTGRLSALPEKESLGVGHWMCLARHECASFH